MTDHDFETLRVGRPPCPCACLTGGPCEHSWDGAVSQFVEGFGWTATCSRCGITAVDHSTRVGP